MLQHLALQSRRVSLLTMAVALTIVGVVPAVMPSLVSAAPAVTERELQSTTAVPGVATDLTWVFDTTADAGNADYIEIQFCDTPLSACTTVNTPTLSGTPTATLGGPWTSTGVASTTREAGLGGGANNQFQIDKTNADDAASKDELTISFGASDIVNNAAPNTSYYTRMRIYSDTGTTLEWEGVFAQSTSQTLTVNARVQERLDFCVGSTAVNDGTSATPVDCTAISGNSVDIGNIESGTTNVSPVDAVNGGSDENGLAMVRTNAVNGVVVDYRAIQDNSSGQLKVPGSTCSGVSTTDQCFNSAGAAATTITAGAEKFGMVVAGVNCTSTSAYTCSFAGGTYNLIRDAAYDGAAAPGNTYVADSDLVPGTTSGQYAWTDNGTADTIASSAGSAVKVVDDEALILKFAATAGITTPTGSYSVQTDFIATATF
jgi:hypothetical protein